jgi:Asp/Glu/hydantoin racemase
MFKRVALIHTVTSLVPVFKSLCAELVPDADIYHVVDESLLQNTIREGSLSTITTRRVLNYVISAEQGGADAVMVTCSSIGPAVDLSQSVVSIPVLRVDGPMADYAVRGAKRIGVAATLQTTLEPTATLIKEKAKAIGKSIDLYSKLCEGAFEAVISGNAAKHDEIVSAGLRELMGKVDVIVLAQASMARVADGFPEDERQVPILSSPRLAVERLAEVLQTI